MDKIELANQQKKHNLQHQYPDYSNFNDAQIESIDEKFRKGCKAIFHRQGYMNSKGDAPYDFTCDYSHLCEKCKNFREIAIIPLKGRQKAAKILQENTLKVKEKLALVHQKLFQGQQDCKCSKQKMCEKCIDRLQKEVTRYEKGCGAQWIEQFGGMAAGPAYVTCKDNKFVCDSCTQELQFIQKIIQKQYPSIKLQHLKGGEIDFWVSSYRPAYYKGILDKL